MDDDDDYLDSLRRERRLPLRGWTTDVTDESIRLQKLRAGDFRQKTNTMSNALIYSRLN
jgi:hypothetical protein